MDVVDRGAKGQTEQERGRVEVEQGMAKMTGETSVANGASGGGPASSDQSAVANQASYGHGGSAAGNNQGYLAGVAGAGTTMPLNAALGAGAGGAYPETQYAASTGYNTDTTEPNRIGGRNDREFEGCRNSGGPEFSRHPYFVPLLGIDSVTPTEVSLSPLSGVLFKLRLL